MASSRRNSATSRTPQTIERKRLSIWMKFPPDDQLLLALGAVFRWSIGYKTSNAGQRERVSQIRFVRIPGWRKSAVEEIERRATQLQERFPLT